MTENPTTFAELFKFYNDYAKLLYSAVQADNVLPLETLFELNAALDHVSRHWTYQAEEAEVVARAYAHLKRSCLDMFKVQLKTTTDQYKQLMSVDIGIIDNGKFENGLIKLYQAIKSEAIGARQFEGMNKEAADGPEQCFAHWQPVYSKCVQLQKEYFEHEAVDWARKNSRKYSLRALVIALATGFVSGLLANWLFLHLCGTAQKVQ